MKSMIAVAFSVAFLAVVSAKLCTDSEDCAEGQCCAGFMPFRGTCKPFTKEGGKCLINKAIFPFNEIYIVACPCAEGLDCTHQEGKKNKNNGVCLPPPTTAEPETTPEGEVTTEGEVTEDVTKDGSGEVTKDGSGEVTKDGSGEVTKDGSGEVTKDGSGEVTKDESGDATTDDSGDVTDEVVTGDEGEVTSDSGSKDGDDESTSQDDSDSKVVTDESGSEE